MADSINYQLAKFVASYGKVSQIPESTCPEVSFVGRSNVGKSSIMNKLFGRKNLVKVSSTPGKTSNINFFEATGRDQDGGLPAGGRLGDAQGPQDALQHDVLGRDAGRRLRTKCMPGLRRKDAARFVVMDSVCV